MPPWKKGENTDQTRPRKKPKPPPPFVLGGINKQGRPPSYQPEYDEAVRRLRLLMMTKDEIATFFGVAPNTLTLWATKYPSFNRAYAQGGEIADARTVSSLAERANGMWIEEEQAVKMRVSQYEEKIEIIKVKKYIPPDYNSAALLLSNRQKDRWKLKSSVDQPSPNVSINITGGLPDE